MLEAFEDVQEARLWGTQTGMKQPNNWLRVLPPFPLFIWICFIFTIKPPLAT